MMFFEADLAKLNAALTALGAVVVQEDGSTWIDPTKAPEGLLSTYAELTSYGYANGQII